MCSECGKCYNTRSNLTRHACNRLATSSSEDTDVQFKADQIIQHFDVNQQK